MADHDFPAFEDRRGHRAILLTMTLLLVVFGLWGYFARIDQQVRGVGSIVPSGQSKVIQHLEGGIVTSIMVGEGQQVEIDQPLFQVSNQQAESDRGELNLQALSVQLQVRRLQAELDGREAVDFAGLPADMPPTMVDSERQLFQSRMQNFRENLSILEEQVKQKKFKLDDLQTQRQNLADGLKTAQEQHAINEKLHIVGAMSESRYLQSKSVLQDVQTRYAQADKSIPIINAELEETYRRIAELRQKRKSEVIDELRKANLMLAQLEERTKTPDDKLRRMTVTSPLRGVVNKLYVNTVGGVIKPGDKLAEIIPLDDKLIVEARVPTKDRGLIYENLPALVKITAYDYSTYGGIPGRVTDISADTFNDERNNVPYYRVRIELERNSLGNGQLLYPGMTADVNIMSGKVTVWQYLMRPIWRVRDNALRDAQ